MLLTYLNFTSSFVIDEESFVLSSTFFVSYEI